jgi:hypothetical protein
VRPGTQYFSPSSLPGRQVVLEDTFDTNERQASAVTYVAPGGADLQDGYRFQLGDGSRLLTFEFDEVSAALPNGNGVTFGNIRIPFQAVDSPAKVATAMRAAINAAVAQNGLRIKASTAFGGLDTTPSDARINLYGPVAGDFVSVNESTAPVAITPTDPNHVRMPALFTRGIGDRNAERLQGQIIVDSNYISDVKTYGIWSDPGERLVDPSDASTNVYHENIGLHSPALGAVRNLPTTNDDGRGPAWSNSLFEDNAEFGFGYRLTCDKHLEMASELLRELAPQVGDDLVETLLSAPQQTEPELREQRLRVQALRDKLTGDD